MENNKTLENIIEDRKVLISDIHSNERKMDELENKISELLFERANLIQTNTLLFKSLCSENSIFLSDYSLLESEWSEKRFQSDLVRQTVSNLRNLLFDKNNELLKNFFCIHMKIDNNFNYELGGNLSFYFSDGKNNFKISFYSISFDSLRTDLIYNRYNCHIAIYSINEVIGEKLIYSSLDFDEIRDKLSNYITNNSNFNGEEIIEKTVTDFLSDNYNYYSRFKTSSNNYSDCYSQNNYSDYYPQYSYSQQRIEHMDVISLLTALNFKI
jgi:hypothetical protein